MPQDWRRTSKPTVPPLTTSCTERQTAVTSPPGQSPRSTSHEELPQSRSTTTQLELLAQPSFRTKSHVSRYHYQHFPITNTSKDDSANIDGSPSYTFYDGTIIDPGIRTGLGLGWYVNVPDYEGPLAAFTAGVQSGHATIDSIRAVLNAGFGLAADANCALWGYSGGAAASEWAAELQVQYAPELRLAGIAMGGLTPNITSVAETLNGGPFAASIPEGMLGIVTQDPVAERYLLSQLKPMGPRNATAFLAARRVNTTVNAIVYANQDIFDYFVSGASVLRNYSPLRALADRDGVMGYHGIPAMPMFIYKAIGDEFSPVVDTDGLVERYCAVGANIHYTRNTVGGHLAEFFNGWDNAEAFLNAVLDGSYSAKYQSVGCTVRNVTIAVDSSPE